MSTGMMLGLFTGILDALGPELKAKMLEQGAENTALDVERMRIAMEQDARRRAERRPMKKELFSIYQVDNGFLGELQSGGLVIGATLSEVCAAAQAQAATAALMEDDGPTAADPLNQRNRSLGWQRLTKP